MLVEFLHFGTALSMIFFPMKDPPDTLTKVNVVNIGQRQFKLDKLGEIMGNDELKVRLVCCCLCRVH
jgi:hypothetical protein